MNWSRIRIDADEAYPEVGSFFMSIKVPEDVDEEEYIDDYLSCILDEALFLHCEWDFIG